MISRDQQRANHARQLLTWGVPLLGVILLPFSISLEEQFGLWVLFKSRGPIAPPKEAVVIAIDETTEATLGPINRSTYAALIDSLASAGAEVIVLDVFMLEETVDDPRLAGAIGSAGNVILGARIDRSRRDGLDVQRLRVPTDTLALRALDFAPWPVPEEPSYRVNWANLEDASSRPTMPVVALHAFGFDAFMAELGEVRPQLAAGMPSRRDQLDSTRTLADISSELRAAFAADAALAPQMRAAALGRPGLTSLVAFFEAGEVFSSDRLHLNYYGPPRTIKTLSFTDVLASGFDGASVSGATAFVGFSALAQPGQELEDDDYPFVFSVGGFNLSGVEMAATAFANLLHADYVKLPSVPIRALIVIAWGFLIAFVATRFRVRPGLLVAAVLALAYLAMGVIAFDRGAIWLPIVVPGLQLLFAAVMLLRSRQLSDRVQLIIAAGEEAALALTHRGKREKVDHRVVLYVDEAGSKRRVRLAEQSLSDAGKRELRNRISVARDLPVMTHRGNLTPELGDSMLAYWTTARADDEQDLCRQINNACTAALEMHDRMAELGESYPGFGITIRVGIDWGQISSHLNPSPGIQNWRLEGTPIHTAERLESLSKSLGTSTLISAAIAERLDRGRFMATELGSFVFCDDSGNVVVDKVSVYSLSSVDTMESLDQTVANELTAALVSLRDLDWVNAARIFEDLAGTKHGLSKLAARYAEWCRQSEQEGDSSWRGVVMVAYSDKSQYMDRYL